jgi:hypothetical protein
LDVLKLRCLILSFALFGACGGTYVRRCETGADCMQNGVAGECTASPASADMFCAYPDTLCESGIKWGVAAGDDLADACVAAPPGEMITLILTDPFAGEPAPPVFAAYQDGDAPWEALSGTGTYMFKVTSGRYGVAIVCDHVMTNGYQEVTIVYRLVAEERVSKLFGCASSVAEEHVLSGSVAGLAGGTAQVNAAGLSPTLIQDVDPTYSIPVTAGVIDILAARFPSGLATADALYVHRDLNISVDQSIDIDFDNDTEFLTGLNLNTLAVQGALDADETLQARGQVRTRNGSRLTVSSTSGTNMPWASISTNPWGINRASATAVNTDSSSIRIANEFRRFSADVSVTLPPRLMANTMIIAIAPYVLVETTWSAVSGSQFVSFSAGQDTSPGRSWTISASAGWLDGAARLALPDLSTANGWENRWGLELGTQTGWFLALEASSLGAGTDTFQDHTSWSTQLTGTIAP